MKIEPIPWLRVGAFVRERETGEIYRITDCPETVSLRDIGGEEVEIGHVGAERYIYLTTFLREFTPARKPKDWQEPALLIDDPVFLAAEREHAVKMEAIAVEVEASAARKLERAMQ